MENLIRAVQIDEHQLLQCIKYGLWGSEKNRKWRQNDILIFFVKDELAAKAKVVGTHFKKGVSVWSDPKFDKLIEIQFESYITRENREIGKEKYLIEASHNKNIDSYLLASKPIESKLAISNIKVDPIVKTLIL